MPARVPPDPDRLARSLKRAEASLAPAPPPSAPVPSAPHRAGPAAGLLASVTALVVVGVATGHHGLLWGALALLVSGGLLLFSELGRNVLGHLPGVPQDPERPHVGMGASIEAGAVIEPGASVEMGATVGAGAVIRRGAVVRMGSAVGPGAVIEAGAVVSWGADVGTGAVVEASAVVGAGSSIAAHSRVPADARVLPGSTFSSSGAPVSRAPVAPTDPRHLRIDAACDRLLADLARTSPQVRAYLGEPGQTVSALRATCHQLLEREQALRAESTPEALERLEQEKAVLAARASQTKDEAVRRSLGGALAAIADQQRQRAHLGATAERLDAEATRLVLTVEAMSAQVVRLAAASSAPPGSPEATSPEGLPQLQTQIEAVAEALESLAAQDAGLAPVAPIAAPAEPGAPAERVRG